MPDREISTTSLVKVKFFTRFLGFRVVTTRKTPEFTTLGAMKHKTEWRLVKKRS